MINKKIKIIIILLGLFSIASIALVIYYFYLLPLDLKKNNIYTIEGKKFARVWKEKTNVGPRPGLKDFLKSTDIIFREKIKDEVSLLGFITIQQINGEGENFYIIEASFESKNRQWNSDSPIIYKAEYNKDFTFCANKNNRLSTECLSQETDFTTGAITDNRTIVITEYLLIDAPEAASQTLEKAANIDFSRIQSQDIQLDSSEVLQKIFSTFAVSPDLPSVIMYVALKGAQPRWSINIFKDGKFSLEDRMDAIPQERSSID